MKKKTIGNILTPLKNGILFLINNHKSVTKVVKFDIYLMKLYKNDFVAQKKNAKRVETSNMEVLNPVGNI